MPDNNAEEQMRNIPAGSPPPPQRRKQVMDIATGVMVNVVDDPTPVPVSAPVENEATETPDDGFVVGKSVSLTGKVTELSRPQGGILNVKVQLDNNAGSVWVRHIHLKKA